jgi:hypothetical protein
MRKEEIDRVVTNLHAAEQSYKSALDERNVAIHASQGARVFSDRDKPDHPHERAGRGQGPGQGALTDHRGSIAWIAGPNSIIGSAASHIRAKCASNFAAASGSRMITKSLSCAVSPEAVKLAEPVRKVAPSDLIRL